VAGDEDAIVEEAKRGLAVFMGRGRCESCHNGPHLSDGLFHNLGVPKTGDRVPAMDFGRFQDIPGLVNSAFSSATNWSDDTTTGRLAGLTIPPPESTRGAFRTPSLRGVALTPPYMHSGQIRSLKAVVDFYDAGGGDPPASGSKSPLMVPLHLSATERSDLVAFMETLTGDPVPAARLVDTSAP
jgi:cytochrome c peroxidase